MNITSDYHQRYAELRDRLSGMLARLAEPLNHAATLLGVPRTDRLGELRGQLEKDLFSLVLIGAFQSGKSTLFNYLCDGRELSPVGPFGGGIRTSGCRVTAHPLPEGEPERAEIQWRTPGELLLSFGSSLCSMYGERCRTPYLTEEVVALHEPAQREELSGYAWKLLTSKELSLKDEERELLRFALLVCRFFPQYEQWRQQGTYRDFGDMLRLTSYPQDWASLWNAAEQTRDLSPFEDKVSFIFVGGVDLYLDSAPLRQLGCSVTDCPGLFISPWDTRIAEQCIREAHAILYLFSGEKALSQDDVKALEACVDQGGRSRLLFGANLRVSKAQWDHIATQAVIPVLEQKGFRKPEIHSFHSGMALRARERMAQHWGMLDANSAAAIDLDIELSQFPRCGDAAQDRTRYLEQQLTKFLSILTAWRENLNHFPPTDGRLEERSGVPSFICAAKDFVVERRAGSILREHGTKELLSTLNNTRAALETQRAAMAEDEQQARDRIERARRELGELRSIEKHTNENIENAINRHGSELCEWAARVVFEAFENRKETCKEIFLRYKPSLWDSMFGHVNVQGFGNEMAAVMMECLHVLQEHLSREAATLSPLCRLQEIFRGEQMRLTRDVEGMKDLRVPELDDVAFPETWGGAVSQLLLPHHDELWRMLEDQNDGWEWFWAILTFGVSTFFTSDNAYAEAFWEENVEKFQKGLLNAVYRIMHDDQGPVGSLCVCAAEYADRIKGALDRAQQHLEAEEQQLNRLQHSEDRQQRAQQLGAMAADFAGCIREAENLQGEVDDFLR